MKEEINLFEYTEKGKYAPKPELPYITRENVALIIKYANQYLFLSWNEVQYQKSLVTGGIDSNEAREKAIKREIEEETGYYDIEVIIPVDGINVSKFYVEHKKENRKAIYYPYLVILKTLNSKLVAKSEQEQHACVWYDEKELDKVDLFENHRYMLNKALEQIEK